MENDVKESRNFQFALASFFIAVSLCLPLPGLCVPQASSRAANDTPTKANPSATKKNLHRADFRVKGASCVSCLRRISKTMREQPGVVKGDVSIFNPYWAIVIYDGNQTNMEKIYESVKGEKVSFEDLEDRVVDGLPLIVIPKGLSQTSANGNPPGTAGSAH